MAAVSLSSLVEVRVSVAGLPLFHFGLALGRRRVAGGHPPVEVRVSAALPALHFGLALGRGRVVGEHPTVAQTLYAIHKHRPHTPIPVSDRRV